MGQLSTKQLDVLAAQIRSGFEKLRKSCLATLEIAVDIGGKLNRAKESVPHGEWGQWLEENCDVTERQAQRYMRLDKHQDVIEGHDTIQQALKALAKPKSDSESDLTKNSEKNDSGVAGKDGANPAAAGEAAEEMDEWEWVEEAEGSAEGTEARTDASVLKKRLVATIGAAIREVDRLHDSEPNFPKAEACRQKLDQVLKVVDSWRVK